MIKGLRIVDHALRRSDAHRGSALAGDPVQGTTLSAPVLHNARATIPNNMVYKRIKKIR